MYDEDDLSSDISDDLTIKFLSVEDYLSDKPCSTIDLDLAVDANLAQLEFSKSIIDMAFIITHDNLISKISDLQKYIQSKYGFTTHCIYIQDILNLKSCIKDLKSNQIKYAIVIYEKSFIKNSMDIYILYPYIEVQKNMTLAEIEILVKADFDNLTEQIKIMKKIPSKNPHPTDDNNELFQMNNEFRYLLCLLSDSRMLKINELKKIKEYLEFRKKLLEQKSTRYIDDRSHEAFRKEQQKQHIYEPFMDKISVPFNKIKPFQPTLRNTQNFVRPRVKLGISGRSKNTIMIPMNTPFGTPRRPNVLKAKVISNQFSINLQQIQEVTIANALIMNMAAYSIEKALRSKSKIVNDSIIEKFIQYEYHLNVEINQDDVISLSSGACSPFDDDMFLAADEDINRPTIEKRKGAEMNNQLENILPPKFYLKNSIDSVENVKRYPIKNCPETLINLFRLILNTVPLPLPHDNALVNILCNFSNEVQNGILVPSLRNVMIDYSSCKSNGVNEINSGIYGIYDVPEKPLENVIDFDFIWKKYFPEHLSGFNILILFYRLIKLLILFKLFNNASECKTKMMNLLEKVNLIVDFDFKLGAIVDQNHLKCFTETFESFFKRSEELHNEILYIPQISTLKIADTEKNIDKTLRQKKIEFTIGPLLNYFANSVNSIHQHLELEQIKNVYNAIRTFRFCIRKIHPLKSNVNKLNNPKMVNNEDDFNRNLYNKNITEELKWLLEEIKHYQCVLFTELHYEFINCMLDFSFTIEKIVCIDSNQSKNNFECLIAIDPIEFINSFLEFDSTVYQYHPDTEIDFLKKSLKDNWVHTLLLAFKGDSSLEKDLNSNRIIKEINIMLPVLWGLRSFDEAVIEAARLNYNEWRKVAQNSQLNWYENFTKYRYTGIVWLNKYHLPYTKAVEELQKYENILKNEFLTG